MRKRNLFNGVARFKRDSYSNSHTSWWSIRKQVFDRDGGVCQSRLGGSKCGDKGKDVHHIIPLSRGGTTTLSNLMTVCEVCHKRRHRHMG
jgi:5-methylcytosine-specific restriction endonuclease McrA